MGFDVTISEKPQGVQLYSGAYVFVAGALLSQNVSVTVEKKNNGNPIFTLGSGFAGLSLGAGVAEVTIENAVPVKDFEFNPDSYMRTGAVVEIGIVMAARQTVFKGFLQQATYSYAIGDNAKLSIKLICRYEDFE